QVKKLLGIEQQKTSSYHPQTDGLVERFNQTLEGMLSKYVSKSQKDWDLWIPHVVFAYNTSEQERTGYSPYYLMFGNNPNLPSDLKYQGVKEDLRGKDYRVQTGEMVDKLMKARAQAMENLNQAQKQQKKFYDQGREGHKFIIGDKVWLHHELIGKGKT